MASILALLRVSWLSATSYRLATFLSFISIGVGIVPLFFVAGAIQGIAGASIARESPSYFGFVIVGMCGVYLITTATSTLSSAVAANIGNGTLESLFVTRTGIPAILAGLMAYSTVQTMIRTVILIVSAALLGVSFSWPMFLPTIGIALLAVLAYLGIGLVAAALVLNFRTSGPLVTAVIGASSLLGGIYYAASSVPGWLQGLTGIIPLTYALRASRMLLLGGASLGDVVPDVAILFGMTAVSMLVGTVSFSFALHRARRLGTLSQY